MDSDIVSLVLRAYSVKTPNVLLQSVEQLATTTTEPLDPYLGLLITTLVSKVADMAYQMGYADGGKGKSP